MLWLKSCPRRERGDLYEGRDGHGPFIACLQCGHYLSDTEEVVLRITTDYLQQRALREKSAAHRDAVAAAA